MQRHEASPGSGRCAPCPQPGKNTPGAGCSACTRSRRQLSSRRRRKNTGGVYFARQLFSSEFFNQLEFCEYEIQTGPDKKMKWGVVNNTRDPRTGEIVHDDLVLSAALVAALDEQDWTITGPSLVVQGIDPLLEMDKGF